jgi:hypothetical protein
MLGQKRYIFLNENIYLTFRYQKYGCSPTLEMEFLLAVQKRFFVIKFCVMNYYFRDPILTHATVNLHQWDASHRLRSTAVDAVKSLAKLLILVSVLFYIVQVNSVIFRI